MTEDVESFRLRAREWLAATMPRLAPGEDAIRRSRRRTPHDASRISARYSMTSIV